MIDLMNLATHCEWLSSLRVSESFVDVTIISYRVTGLYRLGKTCYLHSLLCNNSIITQFSVQ